MIELREAQVLSSDNLTAKPLKDWVKSVSDLAVNVKNYGAKGDGVTNDGPALQAAFDAAKTKNQNVFIPTGTYLYSTQLLLRGVKTIEIKGDGARSSILRWNGSASGTAFKMLNCYRVLVRGLRFDRNANDPAIMVEWQEDSSQSDYDASAPSQLNRMEECTVKNGGVGVAVDLGASSADVMNDSHVFDHNIMDGQTVANVQMTGANVLRVGFRQNYFTGAPSAVQVMNSPGGGAPGFYWHGGYVASTVVNFDLQNTSGEGYQFRDCRSESSPRFLKVGPGGGTASCPITIDGVSYSAAALNADGFTILATAGGPYNIRGSAFYGTSQPKFSFALANKADVIVEGCSFETTNSVAATIVNGSGFRVRMHGNRYLDAAGTTRVIRGDTVPSNGSAMATATYATGSGTSLGATDWAVSKIVKVVATNALQFGWDNPINAVDGQVVHYQIKNASGGALNAANPFAGTKFRVPTYVAPANGKNRTYSFFYDATVDAFYQLTDNTDVAN